MYKLGITGGIGSGKTTASDFFVDKKARIFNADKEAKSHLKKTIMLQHKIIDSFGEDVVENNNKLSLHSALNIKGNIQKDVANVTSYTKDIINFGGSIPATWRRVR